MKDPTAFGILCQRGKADNELKSFFRGVRRLCQVRVYFLNIALLRSDFSYRRKCSIQIRKDALKMKKFFIPRVRSKNMRSRIHLAAFFVEFSHSADVSIHDEIQPMSFNNCTQPSSIQYSRKK